MTLKQIASLGKELAKFLLLFVGCFRSRPGFALLRVYVQGLLSNLQRKNIEAIALEFGKAPRTYSVSWNRSSGMRAVCATNASGWSRATTLMRRPSAALTNRERPRAARIPSAPSGSGWGVAARSTMASSACISATARPAFNVCWTVKST